MSVDRVHKIQRIHTLGPAGTNCEKASNFIREQHDLRCDIILHDTLEAAVHCMDRSGADALVACVVYPDLHEIVFRNLNWLQLSEAVVVPTHEMVLAKRRDVQQIKSVSSHPAPESLTPEHIVERIIVNSNVVAAAMCADGKTDGCITVIPAAEKHGLEIVSNFGPIPMGFTLHTVNRGTNDKA